MLEVILNGKSYQIGCSDEDKAIISSYVEELSTRIQEFKSQDPIFFMGLNEERIFLFQALLLIGELRDIKTNNGIVEHNSNSERALQSLAENIEQIKQNIVQIESLVTK